MAEIHVPQKAGRRKVHSTTIDFTPMVDLGFLLITFFIVSTTLAKPKVMELNMPSDMGDPTVWPETSTITLIPVSGHRVAYYYGSLSDTSRVMQAAMTGVRDILLSSKKVVAALPLSCSVQAHKLHVLIKPNEDCKYEDVVHLLDEMSIVNVAYYSIADVTEAEKARVEKK